MLWKRSADRRDAYPSTGFLIAAGLMAVVCWIAPLFLAPHRSVNETILFRQGGDPDYLTQVAAVAHFNIGETSVIEHAGKGVRSFPVASVLPHALLFRLWGGVGFILADILVTLVYAWLLRYYLCKAGTAPGIAELLSIVVVSGMAGWIIGKSWQFGLRLPVAFWEIRFPRPFVTEVFVICFFLFAYIALRDADRQRLSIWFLLGLTLACLVQSDIYEATNTLLVLAFILVYLAITGSDRKAVILKGAVTSATVVVFSLFFIYQYLHTSKDVMRRWGVFPTYHRPVFIGGKRLLLAAAVVLAIGILLAYLSSDDRKRHRQPALILAGVAVIASLFSCPLSTMILRQTVQIYHYRDDAYLMIGYACTLYVGYLLTDALHSRLMLGMHQLRRVAPVAGMLVVTACLVLVYRNTYEHVKSDYPTAPSMLLYPIDFALKHYRSDFSRLHQHLGLAPYSRATVLGTIDLQLADWWQYQGKYLYLPDNFDSLASDHEHEARVCSFVHMLGSSTEEFGQLLDSGYLWGEWIGAGKYIANSLFTPWPIEDYSGDAQQRIAQTSPLDSWHLELPRSERHRLMDGYSRTSSDLTGVRRPDIIILNGGRLRKLFHPERGPWKLAWSSGTFELWVPTRSDVLTKATNTGRSNLQL